MREEQALEPLCECCEQSTATRQDVEDVFWCDACWEDIPE